MDGRARLAADADAIVEMIAPEMRSWRCGSNSIQWRLWRNLREIAGTVAGTFGGKREQFGERGREAMSRRAPREAFSVAILWLVPFSVGWPGGSYATTNYTISLGKS